MGKILELQDLLNYNTNEDVVVFVEARCGNKQTRPDRED